MDTSLPSPLLGGLSPQGFMRRHWQKKPLLVRQAVPGGVSSIGRTLLFDLASREEVESRLVVRTGDGWSLQAGPLKRRGLPPLNRPGWTLLVQGLDLHVAEARRVLDRFRFVPDARLDDLMVSYASDGGGVGPHVDSYDVFLLQGQGRRRWRVGPVGSPALVPDQPLKLLAKFDATHDWLLEAGDMLYLPPGWAHDGIAEGECITCSIGFRAAGREEIARDVMQRVLDAADLSELGPLYRDPRQPATEAPAQVPPALQAFAAQAVERLLRDPSALACALGEVLSEPKRGVWFDAQEDEASPGTNGIELDRRTRMVYDDRHIFINGESFRAGGRDATLMRLLADRRGLEAGEWRALSAQAQELIEEWRRFGWLCARDRG